MSDLETALARWLPDQRWFGAKGRTIDGLVVDSDRTLVHGDPTLRHLVVSVQLSDATDGPDGESPSDTALDAALEPGEPAGEGQRESYQVLLGARGDLPEQLAHALIGTDDAGTFWYDAVYDSGLTHVLLQLVADDDENEAGLAFQRFPGAEVETDLTSIVMGAEQSNTSLVFGDTYIFKLFRKVAAGVNPDLEITRALAEAGASNIVAPLGWLDGMVDGERSTLGLLQPFLRTSTEGWALAVTSVRDLYAEADLRADEVGGDFAGESERLGMATGQIHQLLADALPSRRADAADNEGTARLMQDRLSRAVTAVPELAAFAEVIGSTYDQVASLPPGVAVQRIHGDLHLGQALRTETGWVIIDFEGEPARPLAERRMLMSPLRDVAGMLRSFDYAARHLLVASPGSPQLAYRAVEWATRNQSAFCEGYARVTGADPRADGVLLRAFEMDKAVYEVMYEARNRPAWLSVPLGSLERLVEENS